MKVQVSGLFHALLLIFDWSPAGGLARFLGIFGRILGGSLLPVAADHEANALIWSLSHNDDLAVREVATRPAVHVPDPPNLPAV